MEDALEASLEKEEGEFGNPGYKVVRPDGSPPGYHVDRMKAR